VHKINPDLHLIYEVSATVDVYRAECSLFYADSYSFTNPSSFILLTVRNNNTEQIARNIRIVNVKRSSRFKQKGPNLI
jgi:hypothetical protein